jgi:hypothetical protein
MIPLPESLGPWVHRDELMRVQAESPFPHHVQFGPDGMLLLLLDGVETLYHAPAAMSAAPLPVDATA